MSENTGAAAPEFNPSADASYSEEVPQENENLEGEEASEELAAEESKEIQKEIKRLKSLKIKYNGKEEDIDLPFEIEEDKADWMRKQLQMAKMGQSKAQEYSQLEKEVTAFIQELKKNPRKALANPSIGIDVKNLAKEILEEEIANSQKSPEQLEKERLEAKLKDLEDERKREQEEMREQRFQQAMEQAYDKYDNMMSSALNNTDLPKSPYVVKKMTDYMIMSVEAGEEPDMDVITNVVRDEMLGDVKEMFGAMPIEVLEQVLGSDIINKLRKSRVAKGKSAPVPMKSAVKDVGQGKQEVAKPAQKTSFKDFFGI
jgi:hypothetical protein